MIKRMLLREVEYARPGSIEEAVRLLGAHDGARALAGGQTLVNVMKARAAAPEVLVDLADLEELREIGLSAGGASTLTSRPCSTTTSREHPSGQSSGQAVRNVVMGVLLDRGGGEWRLRAG